tara:strand:- start:3840 stop:4562 length:723 start_codon:yes stop_codon:yes gene_type:complete
MAFQTKGNKYEFELSCHELEPFHAQDAPDLFKGAPNMGRPSYENQYVGEFVEKEILYNDIANDVRQKLPAYTIVTSDFGNGGEYEAQDYTGLHTRGSHGGEIDRYKLNKYNPRSMSLDIGYGGTKKATHKGTRPVGAGLNLKKSLRSLKKATRSIGHGATNVVDKVGTKIHGQNQKWKDAFKSISADGASRTLGKISTWSGAAAGMTSPLFFTEIGAPIPMALGATAGVTGGLSTVLGNM